jgi:glycosyltransferase involved in cell wall biosynthesis
MFTKEQIKVSHVSYAVSSQTASYRIHNELKNYIDSKIFVSSKSISSNFIIQPTSLFEKITSKVGLVREIIFSKLYPHNKKSYFSYNIGPVFFQLLWINKLFKLKSNIFHLHWIGNGFINLSQIKKFNAPLVITLHDVWFITGGCHVNLDCKKYENGCNHCPLFETKFNPFNITHRIFNKKIKTFQNKNIEIIVLSNWMKDIVSVSPIFKEFNINLIPNGLNTDIFKPHDKIVARNLYSINPTTKIILFGGISAKSDYNKGYDLLMKCFSILRNNNIELVVFGEKIKSETFVNGFKITSIGYLNDEESLALLYSAADLVIVPSRQESFSQVCLESISCGTPVVAFDHSGPKDIIIHKENGYLAKPYDPQDLARGIDWILNELSISNKLCLKARDIALQKFDIKNVAQAHIKLYNKILLN